MAARAVTVSLPGPLYQRLVQRATETHRTIEAEVVDAVATVLDEPDELPADMAEAIGSLHLLDDEELWRAARQRLALEKAERIEELHLERQRGGLSASQGEALETLMKEYTRVMLVGSLASGCAAEAAWARRVGVRAGSVAADVGLCLARFSGLGIACEGDCWDPAAFAADVGEAYPGLSVRDDGCEGGSGRKCRVRSECGAVLVDAEAALQRV